MIDGNNNDLLDRSAFEPLSNREKEIVQDGQRAGGTISAGEVSAADLARAISGASVTNNSRTAAPTSDAGVNAQTIQAHNLDAAVQTSDEGSEGDISGGVPNSVQTTAPRVAQNEYNR